MARRGLMRSAARTVGRTAMIAGTATAVSGRVAQHQHKKFAQNHQPQQMAMAPPPDMGHVGGTDMVGQLQQLADLRAAGALTDKEFAAAKAKLLKS